MAELSLAPLPGCGPHHSPPTPPADCPQVQCVHPYVAQQPDELTLELADILNILEKTEDGEPPTQGTASWPAMGERTIA